MPTNYKEIISRAVEVKEQRGVMYRNEPKDIAPIAAIEGMILYKAYRAFESLSVDKKIDDYTDLMNYAAFIIERLEREKEQKMNRNKETNLF